MLEGVVADIGSKVSPKCLAISTFSHFLWMWQESGCEQWHDNVVKTKLWHMEVSQNHIVASQSRLSRLQVNSRTTALDICCSQLTVPQW